MSYKWKITNGLDAQKTSVLKSVLSLQAHIYYMFHTLSWLSLQVPSWACTQRRPLHHRSALQISALHNASIELYVWHCIVLIKNRSQIFFQLVCIFQLQRILLWSFKKNTFLYQLDHIYLPPTAVNKTKNGSAEVFLQNSIQNLCSYFNYYQHHEWILWREQSWIQNYFISKVSQWMEM